MKVVVIIPTYNECDNIAALVEALEQQFARLSHDMHILVVDDSSPDGTADVVRQLQAPHPKLHLLSRTKAGLGAAYIRGMHHALDQLGADAVFEMDADWACSLRQRFVKKLPSRLFGDRAYDSDGLDAELTTMGIEIVAPDNPTRKNLTQDCRPLRRYRCRGTSNASSPGSSAHAAS